MEVFLDKDGWEYMDNADDTVKNAYLFDVGKDDLTINN